MNNMICSSKLFIVLSLLLSMVRFAETASVDLNDFSIKLQSTQSSEIGDHLTTLRKVTEAHLDMYISQRLSQEGVYQYDNTTLHTVAFETKEDNRKLLRDLESTDVTYISLITYAGLIQFKSEKLPTKSHIQELQRSAFIGQSKLDYLSRIQTNAEDGKFLKSIDDVAVLFEATNSDINKGNTGNTDKTENENALFVVIIGCTVGISLVLCGMTVYLLRKRKNQDINPKKTPKLGISRNSRVDERLHVDIPGIESVPTGPMSISPQDISTDSSKFTYNNLRTGRVTDDQFSVSVKSKQTETKSYTSTGTIDLSTVDVNVWKKKQIGGDPFDADITKISESSLYVEDRDTNHHSGRTAQDDGQYEVVIRNDGDKERESAYLSKENLYELNLKKKGFGAHSARYQERLYGKKQKQKQKQKRNNSISSREEFKNSFTYNGEVSVNETSSDISSHYVDDTHNMIM